MGHHRAHVYAETMASYGLIEAACEDLNLDLLFEWYLDLDLNSTYIWILISEKQILHRYGM